MSAKPATAASAETIRRRTQRRLTIVLFLLTAGVFGFGYALVPLYNTFCRLTGLNGKTGGPVAATSLLADKVDSTRWVNVEFTSTVMPGLAWKFRPLQRQIRVHPGKLATVTYFAENTSRREQSGRAIMSLSPGIAEKYFDKVQCFCFKEHTLKPGETRSLPVTFFVTSALPKRIRTITLSYSVFPVSPAPNS